jgi:hypothetical protein
MPDRNLRCRALGRTAHRLIVAAAQSILLDLFCTRRLLADEQSYMFSEVVDAALTPAAAA